MLAPFMGLVQGVTEFLPISSSGHLRFFALLFSEESIPFLFDIILHIATLCAVLFFTRILVWQFMVSLFYFFCGKADIECKKNIQSIVLIVVGTFATAPFAFYVKLFVFNSIWFVEHEVSVLGVCFLLTAVILVLPNVYRYFLNKKKHTLSNNALSVHASIQENNDKKYSMSSITMRIAIIVGIVQGFAAFPGISRSGITISIALLLGAKKNDATYFSFLISIPTIVASFFFSLDELQEVVTVFSVGHIVTGMIVAFVSGILMLYVLRFIVQKRILWIFSLYLIPLSIFILFFL